MTSSIFDNCDPSEEPSQHVAFAGNRLDRRSDNRQDDLLERALKADDARAFAIGRNRAILKHDRQTLDPLFAPYELAELSPDFENAALLGYEETGEPRLAVPVAADPEALPPLYKAVDHRSLYMEDLLPVAQLGQFAQGASLVAWNLSTLYCGRCGAATINRAAGYRRECSACGTMFFPRTDPVVIMLVIDETKDLCLLGRSPHFRPGMYSCLAGFLEPGETIEGAVRRETMEESGILVGRVHYHASQPWPMPHTLMIGLYGEAMSETIVPDDTELEDCRWFTRSETADLLDQSASRSLASPPAGAIAHRLMRDWAKR